MTLTIIVLFLLAVRLSYQNRRSLCCSVMPAPVISCRDDSVGAETLRYRLAVRVVWYIWSQLVRKRNCRLLTPKDRAGCTPRAALSLSLCRVSSRQPASFGETLPEQVPPPPPPPPSVFTRSSVVPRPALPLALMARWESEPCLATMSRPFKLFLWSS